MCALKKLVLNPSLINIQSLAEVNHNYRGALRHSHICIEDDMLIFKEPIGGSSSFTRLQIVPRKKPTTSSSLHFTPTQSVVTLTLIGLCIASVCGSTFLGCTPTLRRCVAHSQAAPWPILHTASHLNLSTTFLSKPHSQSCTLMPTQQASTLDSRVLNATSSDAAE